VLNTSPDSRLISLSASVYRALLAAYPAQFKSEYGSHMAQVFRDCCRQAYQEGGTPSLLALWMRTTLDYLKTIIEEYARGGTNMTREKFIKLSGWALLVGSISILIGWLADSRPEYSQFNAASLPIDRYANLAAVPLVIMGVLLVSLGMLGLQARYGGEAGGFGRFVLVFGALCGLVSAIGMVGLAISDSDPWWSMFFLGWTAQYLMLALFGIVCLRRQVLPRWNGLPLLAGVWMPAFTLISLIYESATGSWVEWPDAVFIFLFAIGAAGFAGLGYLLQADAQTTGPAPT
jgi:hypothetical protein